MRQESQPYNKIETALEVVLNGTGVTGLTPTVGILRKSDSMWLANGGTWGAGFATNDLVAVDATNMPGLYNFAIDVGDLALAAGLEGYWMVVKEATHQITEHVRVNIRQASMWDDVRADHTTAGSFGEGVVVESLANDSVDAAVLATDAVNEIADQVWEEDIIAAHNTGDKAGKILGDLKGLTDQSITNQVWDEAAAAHITPASMGLLQNSSGLTAGQVADAVWDALLVNHVDPNSFGLNAQGGSSPSTIATAVWAALRLSNVASGSMGELMSILRGQGEGAKRFKSPSYDPDGRLLSATLVVYPTAVDADADMNALESYTLDATYDGDGNLDSLLTR